MKLKLLILFAFIAVTNAFSQHTEDLIIATGTHVPDGSGNITFKTGTITQEGATFKLQITMNYNNK